jgi:hypothetical protein
VAHFVPLLFAVRLLIAAILWLFICSHHHDLFIPPTNWEILDGQRFQIGVDFGSGSSSGVRIRDLQGHKGYSSFFEHFKERNNYTESGNNYRRPLQEHRGLRSSEGF